MLCVIWYHLYNIKREKHPCRGDSFKKFTKISMEPNRAKRLILLQSIDLHPWIKSEVR